MLKITQEAYDNIIAHSRQETPLEACGYLAEKDCVVCKHLELTNTDQSPEHYSMDPAEQFATVKKCRSLGLAIRAVYHSHPETAARPSAEDIKLAYDPSLSYVIVSLAEPAPTVKSFIIKRGEVQQEPLEIIHQKTD